MIKALLAVGVSAAFSCASAASAISFSGIDLSHREARERLPPSVRHWIAAHPCLPLTAWKTPGTDVAWLVELHCGGDHRLIGVLKKNANVVKTVPRDEAPYGAAIVAANRRGRRVQIETSRAGRYEWKGGSFHALSR